MGKQLWKFFLSKDGEEAIHGQTYWATATTHYWPAANFNLMFAAYSPSKLNVIMKKNADFEKGYVIIKKGKKVFYKAVLA